MNYDDQGEYDYENQLTAEYLIRTFSDMTLALGVNTVLSCMSRLNPEALEEIKMHFNQKGEN